MSKTIHRVHHYVLADTDSSEHDPEHVAEDVLEAAKGGHIVHLHIPHNDETVIVHPHETHEDVTAKMADALPVKNASSLLNEPADVPAPTGKRGGRKTVDVTNSAED